MEQAALERLLLNYDEPHPVHRTVPVRNLEMINARDPFNRQAGWGSINFEKLIAHVGAENAEADRRTMERYAAILEEREEATKKLR